MPNGRSKDRRLLRASGQGQVAGPCEVCCFRNMVSEYEHNMGYVMEFVTLVEGMEKLNDVGTRK
ncbi:hypothetical protein DACRYDRAFT_25416 [Dacryopinax primogenitus]|uniref:Uncharacterized protein n=1 Tax=Dacryopinax primogenitus (strain DJM 731) TaxID=1858805 RepID=M5FPD7_DACPD|nr:uncharacterized protein DACRYDRAFT_25416 [Dacryopinax primogenitus]EJT96998.1 hypothetical protein DACRYDRAFT_25416 [Dacryopinax primogenitus]